ncbi:MAG: hypothetical protein MJ212_04520, partial [Alphaproteobacteria bacterium]|nr:hypothetical protein [Alphaproteobacteria bacterium]
MKKIYMSPAVRRLITTTLIVAGAFSVKGQNKADTEQPEEAIKTTYVAYKNDMMNRRVFFLKILDALTRKRVELLQKAEKNRNLYTTLNTIFDKKAPALYCGFAGFNTIRDAAETAGLWEVVGFIKGLTNQNYCPTIKKDLEKAYKKLKIDNPKGLTVSQRIEKDLKDERCGMGVYACVVYGPRNRNSRQHFVFIAPALDANGKVMRDKKGRVILWEYSFNSNHVSMITGNFKPLAMANLNQISEEGNAVDLLSNWIEKNPNKIYNMMNSLNENTLARDIDNKDNKNNDEARVNINVKDGDDAKTDGNNNSNDN